MLFWLSHNIDFVATPPEDTPALEKKYRNRCAPEASTSLDSGIFSALHSTDSWVVSRARSSLRDSRFNEAGEEAKKLLEEAIHLREGGHVVESVDALHELAEGDR